MFSAISDTGDLEEKKIRRSQTYDLLVTSPGALPLSYRRLVGAKAIKLGPCDKHPVCCFFNTVNLHVHKLKKSSS